MNKVETVNNVDPILIEGPTRDDHATTGDFVTVRRILPIVRVFHRINVGPDHLGTVWQCLTGIKGVAGLRYE